VTGGEVGEDGRLELPPLLPEERDALLAILDHTDFAGRDALLAQARTAQVVRYCSCGCASVDLRVDRTLQAIANVSSPLPNEAWVLGPDDWPIGEIIVFLDDGYLARIEIVAGEPISQFPPTDGLRTYSLNDPVWPADGRQ
jgi:hypothetical protein